ncbi:helix-turn-helix domain-containing protein [Metabacillus halosaccharovorans]|uniref:Helix-turn-helix domain-containing protein n=1 Tax=Metabacillus halosaccharovorans TaxID=930124 RepID=A0ABT3DGX9_9BACI|nr:helix-turn-helix domain-containing protein [Metabacillus halosaccharovorans]MCV9886256.1 helix-turn-helix domain-containing protein [Metabacillus halosaccharovorans]
MSKEEITIEEFSEFVRNMRKSTGLSQTEFANAIGVSFASIQRWEQKKKYPNDIYSVLQNIRDVVKQKIKSKRLIA